MEKLKQTKNLFKKLIKDDKSTFYATDRKINRSVRPYLKKKTSIINCIMS